MKNLLNEIKSCMVCRDHLPNAPRPVVQVSENSKILIIGQAPGRKVQKSGIPWDDPSGDQLRTWLGVNKDQFYNEQLFALVPMGFCYPGKGTSGDLPPRPECAPLWHERLLRSMPNVKLTILIGKYAQDYYLVASKGVSLTDRVKNFNRYLPGYLPLVHPSPRNKAWHKKNPWFAQEVIPLLQKTVKETLESAAVQS
ncbi:uracil-DNA glycosylase [Anseongella ginsenosidimutans]|uniref:Uracil-DNA glycosylase n=1 Tax=Anseongella ginsenosidimutans TaxID=496056 RepID=A0A4R3KS62_9SPHI|nr:uracil-DNA glycosylase family protein [Anseongella ginsenosidimutans]QEC52888.1 uracil-DNA glycosylase family protein [Anseongella ginsenosidimutans]TCS87279.1 uracil-DNA glycosylase [Anseongella ginsenosidimutans]